MDVGAITQAAQDQADGELLQCIACIQPTDDDDNDDDDDDDDCHVQL